MWTPVPMYKNLTSCWTDSWLSGHVGPGSHSFPGPQAPACASAGQLSDSIAVGGACDPLGSGHNQSLRDTGN